jgi:NAD+ synthase (glutamine-hydrolysing)
LAEITMISAAILQFNPIVGDLKGNVQAILEAAESAQAQGITLLITPELALSGYPPEDLLLRPSFLQACDSALHDLAQALQRWPQLTLLLGHPQALTPDMQCALDRADIAHRQGHAQLCLNAASVLNNGRIVGQYFKRELPNYHVFDEQRYFLSGRVLEQAMGALPGSGAAVFTHQGTTIGVLLCEDAWFDEPADAAMAAGAEVLCVLNASPFHLNKAAEREQRMSQQAQRCQVPLIYAHLVGGQDELIFDGASFAVQADGTIALRGPSFDTALIPFTLEGQRISAAVATPLDPLAQLWAALVLGIRDYVQKNRFPGVIIGLSGGVDSALVLALAVDALGPNRVRVVFMPSPYTADISCLDARAMAEGLGVRWDEWPIVPAMQAFSATLASTFAGLAPDTTEENLQARIRGTLLMALSNKTGWMVLTTGNKSEMATGYCTLYGDMAGGYAAIKDVYKTQVWQLCLWRNQQPHGVHGEIREVIPERIITRPPSAELRPDQLDQDSLPEYDLLDAILYRHIEENQSVDDIVQAGFDRATTERVLGLVRINEYKRRQAPIGPRVSTRSFGKDWRLPMSCRSV